MTAGLDGEEAGGTSEGAGGVSVGVGGAWEGVGGVSVGVGGAWEGAGALGRGACGRTKMLRCCARAGIGPQMIPIQDATSTSLQVLFITRLPDHRKRTVVHRFAAANGEANHRAVRLGQVEAGLVMRYRAGIHRPDHISQQDTTFEVSMEELHRPVATRNFGIHDTIEKVCQASLF